MERRFSNRIRSVIPNTLNYQNPAGNALLSGETINVSNTGTYLAIAKLVPLDPKIHFQIEIPDNYYFVIKLSATEKKTL